MNIYKNVSFQQLHKRPFFYSDFVTTLDGKVWVKKDGYWPLGSKVDYDTFTFVRSFADVIIDGKNTAIKFAPNTLKTIASNEYKALRKENGKSGTVEYVVLASHIDKELIDKLKNFYEIRPTIITTKSASYNRDFEHFVSIVRLETDDIDPKAVSEYLFKKNLKEVFIDGGPHILTSFLKENLLDELFLTVAPKFIGNESGETLTLGEGQLFSPDAIKNFTLISSQQMGDEIFLRYRKK